MDKLDVKVVCDLVEVYGHHHSGPVIAELTGVLLSSLMKELNKIEGLVIRRATDGDHNTRTKISDSR